VLGLLPLCYFRRAGGFHPLEITPMTTTITEESDFYFWLVEYLHQLGPEKMYPKALADAADLALELIAEERHEEEALTEMVPQARICPCCGDDRNQALGVVFHLARDVDEQRPYSEAVIHFLADCYCPPASTMFEEAARIGFAIAGFQRSGFFKEYRDSDELHLATTKQGQQALGVRVDLSYPRREPFFRKGKRTGTKSAAPKEKPHLQVISSD
jgi:hypothetical protein